MMGFRVLISTLVFLQALSCFAQGLCPFSLLPDFVATVGGSDAIFSDNTQNVARATLNLRDSIVSVSAGINEACFEMVVTLPMVSGFPFILGTFPQSQFVASIHVADGGVVTHSGRPLVFGPSSPLFWPFGYTDDFVPLYLPLVVF